MSGAAVCSLVESNAALPYAHLADLVQSIGLATDGSALESLVARMIARPHILTPLGRGRQVVISDLEQGRWICWS